MGNQETKQKSIGQGKSLLALGSRFGLSIFEKSCQKALQIGKEPAITVKQIEYICAATYRSSGDIEDSGEHALLRGKNYYNKEEE